MSSMTSGADIVTYSWSTSEPAAWSILVHGGAGDVPPERRPSHVAGCEVAAAAGAAILAKGGSALDAVQRAVEILEDDPVFNAGTGACLNEDGGIELDAAIMEGASLGAGGVCALPPFQNPIAIARRVMDASRHVLLAGEGAARFAVAQGFTRRDSESMITDFSRRRWELVRARHTVEGTAGGTVGAVARDVRGSVSSATSTGGVINKLVGRVGDSPLIGAGTYADDLAGACSATGNGEAIIRVCLAKTIVDGLSSGARPEEVVRHAIAKLHKRTNEIGGAIAASPSGALALARSTKTMSYAARTERSSSKGI